MTHTEEVIAVPLDTIATIVAMFVGLAGFYAAIHRSVRAEFRDFRHDMRGEFATFKSDMRGEFATFKSDMRAEFAEFKKDMRGEFATFKTEVRSDINRLDDRVYGLAAGLRPTEHPVQPWD